MRTEAWDILYTELGGATQLEGKREGNRIVQTEINEKTVWVSVKNTGTLMDIGKVEMFVDGKKVGDAVHYELGAGEEKLIPFKLAKENKQPVAFTTKYKMVSM